MNYEEMKAQFSESEPPTGRQRKRKSPKTTNQLAARPHTPMDTIIRLFPFVLVFVVALAVGTWYLQDTQAANNQIKEWIGVTDEDELAVEEKSKPTISTVSVELPAKKNTEQKNQ